MGENATVEAAVDDTAAVDEGTGEAATAPAADAPEDGGAAAWYRDRRVRAAAVLIAALAITAGAVFGFIKYRSVAGELAALQQAQTDRDTAAQVARDYALKSLTYSYDDPDAFFRAVEDGVSADLKDKYIAVTDVLKQLIVDGQLTSTGEVLAAEATAQPGDSYHVVVSAAQTTRNLQRPTPRVSVILLQINIAKAGGNWQVSDIRRANAGGQATGGDQLPAPEPEPAPTPPAPKPKR